MKMQQFIVIVEKAAHNYSAFVPDVPGCAVTGQTLDETLQEMSDALAFHLEGMADHNMPLPTAHSLRFHLDNGIFNEGALAQHYFISVLPIE